MVFFLPRQTKVAPPEWRLLPYLRPLVSELSPRLCSEIEVYQRSPWHRTRKNLSQRDRNEEIWSHRIDAKSSRSPTTIFQAMSCQRPRALVLTSLRFQRRLPAGVCIPSGRRTTPLTSPLDAKYISEQLRHASAPWPLSKYQARVRKHFSVGPFTSRASTRFFPLRKRQRESEPSSIEVGRIPVREDLHACESSTHS